MRFDGSDGRYSDRHPSPFAADGTGYELSEGDGAFALAVDLPGFDSEEVDLT